MSHFREESRDPDHLDQKEKRAADPISRIRCLFFFAIWTLGLTNGIVFIVS